MSAAEFSTAARAAIYEAGGGRCIGCGRPDVTAQHRRRRGMGGSRNPELGTPANGVPLCGSGTSGCHGWTEANPLAARALGWALDVAERPLEVPFWTRDGWLQWVRDYSDLDLGAPFYGIRFLLDEDLDPALEDARAVALDAYATRAASWR